MKLQVRVVWVLVFVFTLLHACGGSNVQEFWPGETSDHQTGSQDPNNPKYWLVTVDDPSNAFLTYGPYITLSDTQSYRVDFTLSIDNNSADTLTILQLDVNDANTQTILSSRNVIRTDFVKANVEQVFSLFFENSPSYLLEFRVYYYCCAEIIHFSTTVHPLDQGALGSVWNGTAGWNWISSAIFETSSSNPSTGGSNEGSYFVTIGTTWYLFYREYQYNTTPSYCESVIDLFRIVVRQSEDQGRSWSEASIVAEPVPNTPSECALVDGSAMYDSETNTWHYLSQCIARTGGWNMCHYFSISNTPMNTSTWQTDPNNPVVYGGELFSQICAGSGKHCSPNTVDEGTPDIVEKRDGYFYVTFHGYDYSGNSAARGIAKTADWDHWIVASYDLPDDAIFSSIDCQNWSENWASDYCVGGGEADILRDGDYYYQIIEAMDVALTCDTTLGAQNWVEGLVRAPAFYYTSGQWEQFRGQPNANPYIVPSVKYGCYLQYARLFKDTNGYYLSYWVNDFGSGVTQLQTFQLTSASISTPIIAAPIGNTTVYS